MASITKPNRTPKYYRKRTVTTSEKKRRRNEYSKSHKQISLGKEHNRWRALRSEMGLKSDERLATVLLDQWYTQVQSTTSASGIGMFDVGLGMNLGLEQPIASSTPSKQVQNVTESFPSVLGPSELESNSFDISGIEELTKMEERVKETDNSFVWISLDEEDFSQSKNDTTYIPSSDSASSLSDDDSDLDMEFDFEMSIVHPNTSPSKDSHIMSTSDDELDFHLGKEDNLTDTDTDTDDNMQDVVDSKKSICFDSCLMELAGINISNTCHIKNCTGTVEMSCRHNGSAVQLLWICSKGHIIRKWDSQPRVKRIYLGNFLLSCSILCSGNNYKKIALLFKFLNLGITSSTSHHQIQRAFTIPKIQQFYDELLKKNLQRHKGKNLVIAGDGRNDSPGHSAMYCTYTFMEYESKDILACEVIDKRMTNMKSTNMEKAAFKRALNGLLRDGFTISEVCTDAHPQISCLLKNEYTGVFHSFDTWHGAKNFGKKLLSIAADSKNKELRPWVQDLINHFWYCSKHANGSELSLIAHLRGILHHVTNVHAWALGQCDHEDLPEQHDKVWLEPGSQPHEALSSVIMDKRFTNTLKYYINFRHTGELESFHEHILMYAAKRFSYSFPMYTARNQLAVIDYQMHKDRELDKDKNGVQKYHRIYSKRNGNWSVYPVKVKKEYTYMSELLTKMVSALRTHSGPLPTRFPLEEGDPRLIKRTLSATSPIPTRDLVERKKSRY